MNLFKKLMLLSTFLFISISLTACEAQSLTASQAQVNSLRAVVNAQQKLINSLTEELKENKALDLKKNKEIQDALVRTSVIEQHLIKTRIAFRTHRIRHQVHPYRSNAQEAEQTQVKDSLPEENMSRRKKRIYVTKKPTTPNGYITTDVLRKKS